MRVVSLPYSPFLCLGQCGRPFERCNPASGIGDNSFALQSLDADESKSEGARQAGQCVMRGAGDFADGLVVCFGSFGAKLGSGRRRAAAQLKLTQGAVDSGAGADAFDNLLPEVAALVEVERTVLVGFLREIAVGDVDAVERRAFQDAQGFERL